MCAHFNKVLNSQSYEDMWNVWKIRAAHYDDWIKVIFHIFLWFHYYNSIFRYSLNFGGCALRMSSAPVTGHILMVKMIVVFASLLYMMCNFVYLKTLLILLMMRKKRIISAKRVQCARGIWKNHFWKGNEKEHLVQKEKSDERDDLVPFELFTSCTLVCAQFNGK